MKKVKELLDVITLLTIAGALITFAVVANLEFADMHVDIATHLMH